MLSLTRKVNQCIIINDDIVIRICQISGGQVKIGIEAPPNIKIMREELLYLNYKNEYQQPLEFGAHTHD